MSGCARKSRALPGLSPAQREIMEIVWARGEVSASEIENAPAELRTLDKNGDGQITEDEVMPNFGGRGGPGGPDRGN